MEWDLIATCDPRQNINRVFYEPNKHTIHAERSCIMNIKNKKILPKCKMIVVKIINDKPIVCGCCDMCNELLMKYKLKLI